MPSSDPEEALPEPIKEAPAPPSAPATRRYRRSDLQPPAAPPPAPAPPAAPASPAADPLWSGAAEVPQTQRRSKAAITSPPAPGAEAPGLLLPETNRAIPRPPRAAEAPPRPRKTTVTGIAVRPQSGKEVVIEDVVSDNADSIRGVSITVERGAHLAIVGPIGCGKNWLLRLLCGGDLPRTGAIRIDGVATRAFDYYALRTHRLTTGYVFEEQGLITNLPIFESVALPLRYHRGAELDEKAVRFTVERLLAELEIAPHAAKFPGMCNNSVRKRALIARALVLEPALLLVDEPQRSLVGWEQELVRQAVEGRRNRTGMTVIQTDHDGNFGPLKPDYVIKMEVGKVVAEGDPREIDGDE